MAAALSRHEKLCKSFGALTVAAEHRLPARAGSAPRPDRAERRGQDHVRQHADGRARADLRPHLRSTARRSRKSTRRRASSAASAARSRSPRSSATCRCSTTWRSASPSATAWRAACGSRPAVTHEINDEAMQLLATLGLADDARHAGAGPALRQAAPGRDRHRARTQAEGAAARRARGRRAVARTPAASSTCWPSCPPTSRS